MLELERQVAVLVLGETFQQLSDPVNETQALECERQLAVVELEENFKRLSDHVAVTERDTKLEFNCALDMVKEVDRLARRGQADICTLGYRLQQFEDGADKAAGDCSGADTTNSSQGARGMHPLTPSWMRCGSVVLVWWRHSPTWSRRFAHVRCLAWVWWRSSSLTVNCESLAWGCRH